MGSSTGNLSFPRNTVRYYDDDHHDHKDNSFNGKLELDCREGNNGNLYENLEPHLRPLDQHNRYLDLSQELYPRYDEYHQPKQAYHAREIPNHEDAKDQVYLGHNIEHQHRSHEKHVHYEDQLAANFNRDFGAENRNDVKNYEKSERKDKHRKGDIRPEQQDKHNTMPNMAKHKKDFRQRPSDYGETLDRHSDHYLGVRYEPDVELYNGPYRSQHSNVSYSEGHDRSFEISPDMLYTHSFGSSETPRDPRPQVPQGYHPDRDEPYPGHPGEPEYWERIPIEGQHWPPHQRALERIPREGQHSPPHQSALERIPREGQHSPPGQRAPVKQFQHSSPQQRASVEHLQRRMDRYEAEPIPVWNLDPLHAEAANREVAERISLHNNSDPGFHELSFHSQPTPEPLDYPKHDNPRIKPASQPMDNPKLLDNPRIKPPPQEPEVPIEGMRFKQLEVHRTTAAALRKMPKERESSSTRKKSRHESEIYENLRPVENYWTDSSMERARKGKIDKEMYERDMGVYGHEQGWRTGRDVERQSWDGVTHHRNETDKIYTKQHETSSLRKPSKAKERSMSFRYRPQSEQLEQHRDMIQGYLDEINKNVHAPEGKHKGSKHKRHSHGTPSKWEQGYQRQSQGLGQGQGQGQGEPRKSSNSKRFHKKHKHHHKESPRSDKDYWERDRHQAHTLPHSLRFTDGNHGNALSYYELSDPHRGVVDNKGFVVTGKPKKSKSRDKDINAYFLSQV